MKYTVDDLFRQHGGPEAVVEFLKSGLQEQPVDRRLDLQVILNLLGREEAAFSYSQELLKIAPQDPRALFNHGWHLIYRNQLKNGMEYLENGRFIHSYGHPHLGSKMPIWHPQTGYKQRVHLVLEGGLGDQIIHFRFARDLVDKYQCKVTVVCPPAIADLFANQEWVSAIAQREAALGVYHDSWLPGMSAALALGYEHKDISGKPYLSAQENYRLKWRNKVGTKKRIRVGLRWAGNPAFEHQQFRKFPPEILLDLVQKFPQVQFYSFQRDNDLVDLPSGVEDLANSLGTWQDTAAAVDQMDLVISSCTSVAHLAGALGKKTWIVIPILPYFIWALPGKKTVWYESVELFRQKEFGQWQHIHDELQVALGKIVAG